MKPLKTVDDRIIYISNQCSIGISYDCVANTNKPNFIKDVDGGGKFEDLPCMYKANVYMWDSNNNFINIVEKLKDNIHETDDAALEYGLDKAEDYIKDNY